jgi:hypothetical protein
MMWLPGGAGSDHILFANGCHGHDGMNLPDDSNDGRSDGEDRRGAADPFVEYYAR